MAKPELGIKRVCPETGRKFYDLNKDPVVSPYTGKSYPLSFFDDTKSDVIEAKAEVTEDKEEEEAEDIADDSTEVLSLDDADDEATGGDEDKNLPDLGDNTDDEVLEDDDDDDTFLPDDDDDDDDDVSGIVDISGDDED
ncbi:MAG: TIGR02300 family protein [Pseudomonadota bacterium]